MKILNLKPEPENVVVERIIIMVQSAIRQNFPSTNEHGSNFSNDENTLVTDNPLHIGEAEQLMAESSGNRAKSSRSQLANEWKTIAIICFFIGVMLVAGFLMI